LSKELSIIRIGIFKEWKRAFETFVDTNALVDFVSAFINSELWTKAYN
jgi:hypothetical protein